MNAAGEGDVDAMTAALAAGANVNCASPEARPSYGHIRLSPCSAAQSLHTRFSNRFSRCVFKRQSDITLAPAAVAVTNCPILRALFKSIHLQCVR
jgi:hypothetical protein